MSEVVYDVAGNTTNLISKDPIGISGGLNVGVAGNVPLSDDSCGPKPSYTLSIGGGVGLFPAEFHNFIGHTSVLPLLGKQQ